jgi:transposase
MIQQLTSLRGIGVQSAPVLVREAFVRCFANGKALGSYAGLASSPYSQQRASNAESESSALLRAFLRSS